MSAADTTPSRRNGVPAKGIGAAASSLQVSAASEAALRRIQRVGGIRAAAFGLDLVPGVVWVEVLDSANAIMRPGEAHVRVWGGRPPEVFASVARHSPRGVAVTCEVRAPRAWHRLAGLVRWHWWRLAQDPRKRRNAKVS